MNLMKRSFTDSEHKQTSVFIIVCSRQLICICRNVKWGSWAPDAG